MFLLFSLFESFLRPLTSPLRNSSRWCSSGEFAKYAFPPIFFFFPGKIKSFPLIDSCCRRCWWFALVMKRIHRRIWKWWVLFAKAEFWHLWSPHFWRGSIPMPHFFGILFFITTYEKFIEQEKNKTKTSVTFLFLLLAWKNLYWDSEGVFGSRRRTRDKLVRETKEDR